jgi:hypothetical protein
VGEYTEKPKHDQSLYRSFGGFDEASVDTAVVSPWKQVDGHRVKLRLEHFPAVV